MSQTARYVIFVGRVQGVGFRFTALNIANLYQLTGYVRNLPDGTVEMVAQGSSADVVGCIRDIEKSFDGYIKETKIKEIPADSMREDFKITF